MGVNQSVIIRVGFDYTYTFIALIGQGAFGKVSLVERNSKRSVIKKVEYCNVESMARAAMNNTEIKIIAKMNHQNVVKYEDSFYAIEANFADAYRRIKKTDVPEASFTTRVASIISGYVYPHEGIYIVMEYCEHGSLQDLISRGDYSQGSFLSRLADPRFTIKWMMDICKGLDYIHSQNVMHRDIKPANIFIHGSGCLKIGDFGCSKVVAYNQLARTWCGTPGYIAPEVKLGQYSYASDLYSVGVVFSNLCQAGNTALEIYPEMNSLIQRLKAGNPSDRPTAEATLNELSSIELMFTNGYQGCQPGYQGFPGY